VERGRPVTSALLDRMVGDPSAVDDYRRAQRTQTNRNQTKTERR